MSSGIAVNSECLSAFTELKLGKKLKYVIYSVNAARTEIVVEKKSNSKDYDEFISALPEDDCRWAVYDFEFDSGEGRRNKLLFVSWSPDDAKVRQKMLFASSKDALRRALVGIAVEIQGTDLSEVAEEAVLGRILGSK